MNSTHFPPHWAALPDAVAELYAHRADPISRFFSQAERSRALADLGKPRLAIEVIAILPIIGPLTKHARWSALGMVDYERALLELERRPDVGAIVLQIDSPGGTVDGTARLAGAVRRVAASKPVVAFADGCMCSAAYWIASQASAIVAAPQAVVGSIGVLVVHADFSAMLERSGIKVTILRAEQSTRKYEGNPYEPLTKEVKAQLAGQLTTINRTFIGTVKSARPTIKGAEAFTGATWLAESAPAGLVDEIGQIERAIVRAGMAIPDTPPRVPAAKRRDLPSPAAMVSNAQLEFLGRQRRLGCGARW